MCIRDSESMILPLVKYLESHGVQVEYGMDVKNVIIETVGNKKVAKQIVYVKDGQEQTIDLIEDDLVFITNGCCTDTSCYGDQTHAPDLSGIHNGCGESWDMWKAIARQAQHGEYGNPDAFCSDVEATNWMSATVATAEGLRSMACTPLAEAPGEAKSGSTGNIPVGRIMR